MVKSVSQKDSDALQALQDKMKEIETGKAELQVKRNKLKEDKATLQKSKSKLDSQIAKINASKKELDDEVAEANALIKKYSKQSGDYMEEITADKKEVEKIENEIQSIIAERSRKYSNSNIGPSSNLINAKGNGQFCYPTDYRTISSYFYRHSGAFHGALDFPCPVGSNVYAGDAGTVIDATTGWGGGYGNRVFIDHHNGFVTIYGHNSRLLVREGQTVKRGQLIAKSGNTGHSTGPHCHFEVRKNGTRVNPLNYL
ncbi:MAG: peptidoglycan DD-metalloendopeptidase family protein [Eubacterium sp.]|nr:peptidoglycan DD-metalloendopeptidase family protein [Eubacterium sp.]